MIKTEKRNEEFSQGGTDMLSAKVAQSIVDRTMAILNVHVNIMDAEAIVIAAGNPQRVGQFHPVAAKVLKTGKKLSISSNEAKRMEGVKPGITLPITFKGKIIGAVGMTGEPEDVESFGELLKLTTELMLEQASIKEEVYLEQRAREGLLSDLITGHWREYEWHFLHRAEILDYDLKKKHLILVAEIGAKAPDAQWLSAEGGLPIQKLRARMEERLMKADIFGGKIATCFTDSKLTVLYQIPGTGEGETEAGQQRIAQRIYDTMKGGENIAIALGVGGVAQSWTDIHNVYNRAKNALLIGAVYNNEKDILFFNDYATEYMLTFVKEEVRREYYQNILGGLLEVDEEQGTQWNKTLQTYFDNDMNSIQTAEALFLHRNTLIFRLNKIKEATGLQPQKFQDAIRLKLALLMLKMEKGNIK